MPHVALLYCIDGKMPFLEHEIRKDFRLSATSQGDIPHTVPLSTFEGKTGILEHEIQKDLAAPRVRSPWGNEAAVSEPQLAVPAIAN
jgi:hypothetical protein